MSKEANRLKTLALHVKNMRRAQRDYFRTKGHEAMKAEHLKNAKYHESRTDEYLKLLEFEKLI